MTPGRQAGTLNHYPEENSARILARWKRLMKPCWWVNGIALIKEPAKTQQA
jgi:hypothetical protein